MKSMLGWPLRGAALGLLAASALGCSVKVDAKSETYFTGSPKTMSGTYTAGKGIQVESSNGNVKLIPGSSATAISATFQPFSTRPDNEAQQAKDDMNNDLVLVLDDTTDPILIQVARVSTAIDALGADVEVTLPDGFNGDFDMHAKNAQVDADLTGGFPTATTLKCDNGAVDLVGAGGQLAIDIANGTSSVAVSSWSPVDGHVTLGNGDLTFTVAAGLSGNITAVAGSDQQANVVGPSPLPADWTESTAAHNSKSYAFGADAANMGTVALTNEFAFGNVFIDVN